MYSATKKTRVINSFIRTAVLSPRDLYAKYGLRHNTRAIHSSDGKTLSSVIPEGSAVIGQVIAGQNILQNHQNHKQSLEDLPD